jgi:hypothetical protein
VLSPIDAHTYCTEYGQSVHSSEHYDATPLALRSKIKRLATDTKTPPASGAAASP